MLLGFAQHNSRSGDIAVASKQVLMEYYASVSCGACDQTARLTGPPTLSLYQGILALEVQRIEQEYIDETSAFSARRVPGLPKQPVPKPPPPEAKRTIPLSFGSHVVLERLWNADELRALPSEKRVVVLKQPDRTPPEQLTPRQLGPPLDPSLQRSIRWVRTNNGERLVALTFDLCEQADDVTGYAGEIVDYLRDHRIPATFFAGGKWMRSHPNRAMQLIADPLFEVGNHAWTHGNLRVLGGVRAQNEILWTQAQYELLRSALAERAVQMGIDAEEISKIPIAPIAFRFPYGTCSDESLRLTASLGLPAIQWDVVSGDASRTISPQQVVRNVLGGVRAGSIIVFHGNGRGRATPQALPEIVNRLSAQGYQFVTVTKLLGAGEVMSESECYEHRPGDNTRYDRLFGDGTGG